MNQIESVQKKKLTNTLCRTINAVTKELLSSRNAGVHSVLMIFFTKMDNVYHEAFYKNLSSKLKIFNKTFYQKLLS